ncbi:MAG: hypothetical protein OEM89_00720 [Nitrosopumilus sp.]|nr:hypothetical protein [Nitrosopumilus sp.]
MEFQSEDRLWKEEKFFCKYCGLKVNENIKYCSEKCKNQDSVWNWSDD